MIRSDWKACMLPRMRTGSDSATSGEWPVGHGVAARQEIISQLPRMRRGTDSATSREWPVGHGVAARQEIGSQLPRMRRG
jgi:hypothetical protein